MKTFVIAMGCLGIGLVAGHVLTPPTTVHPMYFYERIKACEAKMDTLEAMLQAEGVPVTF